MCDPCEKRSQRLQELAAHFTALADQSHEPLLRQRLLRTAADLTEIADAACSACTAHDVIWVEPLDEESELPVPADA